MYEENRCGRFRHAITDHHFNPSPQVANWPLIGMKLNCRRPLTQTDSSNCVFREALIAPAIGVFYSICLLYPRYRDGRPILCGLNWYIV